MDFATLSRKRSQRYLSPQGLIGSSESSPSEHSSLFDAAPFSQSSRLSSGYTSDTDQDSGPSLAKGALKSILSTYPTPNLTNRSAGTRLFTITEQRSVPTLKTVPSNWTFQRRIATLPSQTPPYARTIHPSGSRHRRCFSVDENALQHHRGSEVSTSASLTSHSSMMATNQSAPLRIPPRPVQAPFKPPERIQTPAGLPRWPGERRYRPNAVREVVASSHMSFRDSFSQYLHSSPSQGMRLRDVLRGRRRTILDAPNRTGARFWRPPTSAHSTRRFEDVDTHPLVIAPIAKAGRTIAGNEDEEARRRVREATRQQFTRNLNPERLQSADSRSEGPAVGNAGSNCRHEVTASQRALQQVSGNAVVVSPGRASMRASIRSVGLPAQVRDAVIAEPGPEQSSSTPGTIRTIDLFNSFPTPPSQTADTQATEKRRRGCNPAPWSLFPEQRKQKIRQPVSSIRRKLQKRCRSELPLESVPGTVNVRTSPSNVAICEEGSARYLESGITVYDTCRAPLTSLDRGQDGPIDSGTPALGTRVLQPQFRSEGQRAVSNGALRFSIVRNITVEHSDYPAHSGEPSQPSTFDVSETMCKHGRAKHTAARPPLQSVTNRSPVHLDGVSAPDSQTSSEPVVTATDYALSNPSAAQNANTTSGRNASVPLAVVDATSAPQASTTLANIPPTAMTTFHPSTLLPTATFQTTHTQTPSVSGTLPGRA